MSAEYTPTTDVVRATYLNRKVQTGAPIEVRKHAADFDRWLAAHDAGVAARAVRNAIPLATGGDGYAIRQRLLERADQIEEDFA